MLAHCELGLGEVLDGGQAQVGQAGGLGHVGPRWVYAGSPLKSLDRSRLQWDRPIPNIRLRA